MIAERYVRAVITYDKRAICVVAQKKTFHTLDCIVEILRVHNNNNDFWQIIAVTVLLLLNRPKNIHRQIPNLKSQSETSEYL